jgi:acylaminoacyl-peptidase
MNNSTKEFAKKYLQILSYSSSLSQGWLRKTSSSHHHLISAIRSIRDVDDNQNKSFFENYLCSGSNNQLDHLSTVPLSANPKAVLFDISLSSRYSVSFYNNGIGAGGTKKETGSFIEIIDKEDGSYRIDTSTIHGKIVGDSWFGGCSWSSDEKYLIYVAQLSSSLPSSKKTVIEELVPASIKSKEEKETEAKKAAIRNKYDYIDDWGEKFVDVSELGFFVLSVVDRKVISLSLNDINEYTIGQPSFIHSEGTEEDRSRKEGCYHIAYVAWNAKPRKLGMIYCYNRKSSIWLADITDALSSSSFSKSEKKEESGDVASPSSPSASTSPASFLLVSKDIEIARSPRSSPSGNTLVFLGNRKGFLSHGGCSELFSVDLKKCLIASSSSTPSFDVRTVVPEVRNPKGGITIADSEFPGLFLDSLPKYPFITENNSGNSSENTILLVSLWQGYDALLKVTLTSEANPIEKVHCWKAITLDSNKNISNSKENSQYSSFQILDIYENKVLGQFSTPTIPYQTIVLNIENLTSSKHAIHSSLRSHCISSKYLPSSIVRDERSGFPTEMGWKTFSHETDEIPFGSVLVFPTSHASMKASLPLIVVPHGGPHSAFSTSFVASYIFLLSSLNACILFVNFRGSTGFGQDSIESLLGKIGTNDCNDILTSMKSSFSLTWNDLLKKDVTERDGKTHSNEEASNDKKVIDQSKVAIVGGSHGGFLASHMCGQYPELFKACCLRNPVTNIPAMSSVTDIPDWCLIESHGLPLNNPLELNYGGMTDDSLMKMRNVSPIAYIEKYKTPTLVCLGAKDRRVPMSQGVEFYHLLQMKSIPSR